MSLPRWKLTTLPPINMNDEEFSDELAQAFVTKANYMPNKRVMLALKPYADLALGVCKELQIDATTYIESQFMFAPVLKGYTSLTPQQLCSKDSKNYVTEYLAMAGDPEPAIVFETQCRMFAQCLEGGWPENLCLANPTLDFYGWFRILMCSERDEEVIELYGEMACKSLKRNRRLFEYLKTIRSDAGKPMDFSRIPGLTAPIPTVARPVNN